MVTLHIGPPKTATTSLQHDVIPLLNHPYLIKPKWGKDVAQRPTFEIPPQPDDLILSDEGLGEFIVLPPATVAGRLASVFPGARVIFTRRDPVALFHSYYRQRIINLMHDARALGDRAGRYPGPVAANKEFDRSLKKFDVEGTGFFAMANTALVHRTFARYFDVVILEFALLQNDPAAYVRAFSEACGATFTGPVRTLNAASGDQFETALQALSDHAPQEIVEWFTEYYKAPGLTDDRIAMLRALDHA
jgi:hypothetical protein